MQGAVRCLIDELRAVADRLECGTSTLSENDALEMISLVCNVSMSKERASRYLNMPTSTFDKKVQRGEIATPHKHIGITEKLWYLKDLIFAKNSK